MKKISLALLFIISSCSSPSPIFEVTVIREVKEVICVENLNGDPVYKAVNIFGDTIRCLIPASVSKIVKPPCRAIVKKSSYDKYGYVIRLKNS